MTRLKSSTEKISRIKAGSIGVPVLPNTKLTASGKEIDRNLGGALSRALKGGSFRIKSGNTFVYYTGKTNPSRIVVVALPGEDPRTNELREAAYAATAAAGLHAIRELAIAFDPATETEIQAVSEGALLATYQHQKYKSKKNPKQPVSSVTVCSALEGRAALQKAKAFAEATCFVRDLVNEPPNVLHAKKFSEVAEEVATRTGLQIEIYTADRLEKMGANAFLSVGKGSTAQGRMIHLTYLPAETPRTHVALVGKGITFDSGGLSLKTEQGMQHMKADMAGAATVLACVRAAKELNLPVQVTGLLMVTENMPDGAANRPGDVVRAMNGKTIEITNTDAEGRLALADGLTFAEGLSPDCILDIATLTGAQVVALGRLAAAIMGNDPELLRNISDAGEKSGETIWPLPMIKKYREMLNSDIADIKNSSGIPEAGSIQGGLFLSEFVSHQSWAHIDIAGPSFQEREWSVYPRNASGFGVRSILTFLSRL